jgi:hypothetical protein
MHSDLQASMTTRSQNVPSISRLHLHLAGARLRFLTPFVLSNGIAKSARGRYERQRSRASEVRSLRVRPHRRRTAETWAAGQADATSDNASARIARGSSETPDPRGTAAAHLALPVLPRLRTWAEQNRPLPPRNFRGYRKQSSFYRDHRSQGVLLYPGVSSARCTFYEDAGPGN